MDQRRHRWRLVVGVLEKFIIFGKPLTRTAPYRDASLVPSSASNISRIDLYRLVGPGDDEFVINLAENLDPHSGSITFTVPDVEPGDNYFVSGKELLLFVQCEA